MKKIFLATIQRKPDYLIVHGLYFPYIFSGAILSLMGYRTVLVLTDPSGVVLPGDGWPRRLLKNIDRRLTLLFSKRFCYGIALSPELLKRYTPKRKHLVFPGIFPEQKPVEKAALAEQSVHTKSEALNIGYFGGVFPGYGVLEFAQLIAQSDLPVTLTVYGVGSELSKIEDIEAYDNRIRVRGIVERHTALEIMRKFDVLVNPRTPATEMEEHSFPSKIFDYALSERPILSTPLKMLPPGIREQLFEYNTNDRANAVAKIEELVLLSHKELTEAGQQFSEKLHAKYNVETLGRKIAAFLEDRSE